MSTPKFAKTHNLVAFLEKPTESEGFKQIIDFLNANPIKHALTINPTIYTSCIKQFWYTIKVKTINGEQQIQALVDKKKVIITEVSVRSDLHLEDVEDEHVTTTSNDPLLSANQALETGSLKRRVKKLEKKACKRSHKLKRLYKIGSSTRVESFEDVGLGDQEDASKHKRMIENLDADEGVALVVAEEVDDEEVVAEKEVSTIDLVPTAGVEAKGIVIQEPNKTPTPIESYQQPSKAKDKGKAKMIEPEKPLKRKDQIMIDEEVAKNLKAQMQAKLEEE
nr:xylulose kinase-1 [Tanacetum cinerariifolium]